MNSAHSLFILWLTYFQYAHASTEKSDKALRVRRISVPNDLSTQSDNGRFYTMVFPDGFHAPMDSCQATEYRQVIRDPECLPLTIPNKYCGGSCASYFVPIKSSVSNDVNGIFEDCRQCEPTSYQVVRVLMLCPRSKVGYKLKKIVLISKCTCKTIQCTLKKK